jgi:hypothetical protein
MDGNWRTLKSAARTCAPVQRIGNDALQKRANGIGLSSIVFSLMPWIWMRVVTGLESPYDIIGVIGALGLAFILAILAASIGSRWWLLALLGPLWGVMLLLSLRTSAALAPTVTKSESETPASILDCFSRYAITARQAQHVGNHSRCFPTKGKSACRHLIQHHAKGKEVGADVDATRVTLAGPAMEQGHPGQAAASPRSYEKKRGVSTPARECFWLRKSETLVFRSLSCFPRAT